MAGLPPKGTYRTYKGWMGGQPGTLENQTKTNAKSCAWQGRTPCSCTRQGLTALGAVLLERIGGCWWTQQA